MARDSSGSHNQPQYSASGVPADAADLSEVANFAALVGNIKIGLASAMNALAGADLWTGLLFYATDTDILYRYSGSAWDSVGGRFPIFSTKGSGTGQSTGGAWTVLNGGLATPLVNRGFTSFTGGALTVKLPGLYEVQASISNAGIGTLGVQATVNSSADTSSALFAAQDDNTGASSTKYRTASGTTIVSLAANDVLRLLAVDTYSGAFIGGVPRDLTWTVKYLASS